MEITLKLIPYSESAIKTEQTYVTFEYILDRYDFIKKFTPTPLGVAKRESQEKLNLMSTNKHYTRKMLVERKVESV